MILPLVQLAFLGSSLAFKEGQNLNAKKVNDGQDQGNGSRLFIGRSKLATIKDAPYVVALVKNDSSAAGILTIPFCSGTIITEKWVLSAAHCIRKVVPVTLFQVIAGCDRAKALQNSIQFNQGYNDSSRQVRSPVDWKIHPQYQYWPRGDKADIPGMYDALLIEVKPFIFGATVNRIGLWAKKWEGDLNSNPDKNRRFLSRLCFAYGWGKKLPVDDITSAYDLRYTTYTVFQGLGGCTCMDYERTRRMLCTEPMTKDSICQGDAGGPLVCQGLLAGFAYLIFRCRTDVPDHSLTICGGENVISAFVYVCRMLSWIYHIVPGAPRPPTTCRSSHISGPCCLVAGFLLSQLILSIHL